MWDSIYVKLDVLRENCPLVFWCVFFSFLFSELLANEYYTYTWGMSQIASGIAFMLDMTLMRNVTGVPFKFDATSTVLVILMTSGTFSTSVGWAVDEDGQPLVPPVSQSNSANMFKWVALLFPPFHSSCQTLGAVICLLVCILQLKPWGSLNADFSAVRFCSLYRKSFRWDPSVYAHEKTSYVHINEILWSTSEFSLLGKH